MPTTERSSSASRPPEPNWTIPIAGETIAGKYLIEGECGRGGLAVVLSAWHAELDRRVAIKLLLPEWSGDAQIVERFLREGRAATSIHSEHCVQIFDVGALDSGAPFLVLEYLEGQNLDDVVLTQGPLPVPTAIDWLLQAAEAIAEGHAHGIVHRDLKPANLFLTRRPDGTPSIKVIDFGLSKVTVEGTRGNVEKLTGPTEVMGSPSYMAPEQLRASCDADPRTDLWALGAVLYELITAQSPFRGGSMPEICAAVLMQPPATVSSLREGVPAGVECAVLRCLEKDPGARYGNIAELAAALAPYGSASSRASCECIERVLKVGATFIDPITLPRLPGAPRLPTATGGGDSDPRSSETYVARGGRASRVSGKVVIGSFLTLAGLGLAALAGMYLFVHRAEPGWGSSNVQSLLRLVTPQAVAASEPKAAVEPTRLGEPSAKTEPMAAIPSGWSAPAPSSQKALPIHLVPLAAPSLRSHTQKPTRAQAIDARQRTVDATAKPSPVDSSNLERTFPPGEPSANAITSAVPPPNPPAPTDEMLDTRK